MAAPEQDTSSADRLGDINKLTARFKAADLDGNGGCSALSSLWGLLPVADSVPFPGVIDRNELKHLLECVDNGDTCDVSVRLEQTVSAMQSATALRRQPCIVAWPASPC